MAPPTPPLPAMVHRARTVFAKVFDKADGCGIVRSPGRVELLGGHTEYNDGFVLPMALPQAVYLAFRPNCDRRVRVHSETFGESSEFSWREGLTPPEGRLPHWLDHFRGVTAEFISRGFEPPGLDIAIVSDLPIDAGLDSSSALTVGAARAMLHILDKELPRDELARLCLAAETQFAGHGTGIMGPFTALMARADHALLLDCLTLEHQAIALESSEYEFLIADTGVRADRRAHEQLARRREQCREAVRLLARYDPHIRSLRHVSPELVNDHFSAMPREVAARARHVVGENLRVLHAAGHLRAGRMALFGRLLAESHTSLRDNYEVSFQEADALVRMAASAGGEITDLVGARLSGRGLGGSVVIVVNRTAADQLRAMLETEFFRQFARRLTVLRGRPSAGAAVLEECRHP